VHRPYPLSSIKNITIDITIIFKAEYMKPYPAVSLADDKTIGLFMAV
jgi:hypothetical protein